jgi:hypothetical protein
MFRVSDSALTPVEVFCVESWHCREKQNRRQYGSCEHRCCCDKKIVSTIHTVRLTLSYRVHPENRCHSAGFWAHKQIRAAPKNRLYVTANFKTTIPETLKRGGREVRTSATGQ